MPTGATSVRAALRLLKIAFIAVLVLTSTLWLGSLTNVPLQSDGNGRSIGLAHGPLRYERVA